MRTGNEELCARHKQVDKQTNAQKGQAKMRWKVEKTIIQSN